MFSHKATGPTGSSLWPLRYEFMRCLLRHACRLDLQRWLCMIHHRCAGQWSEHVAVPQVDDGNEGPRCSHGCVSRCACQAGSKGKQTEGHHFLWLTHGSMVFSCGHQSFLWFQSAKRNKHTFSWLLLGWIFRLQLFGKSRGFPLQPQQVKLFAEGSAATKFPLLK